MSICFEKARELGKLLLESEQSLRLSDARAAFDKDESSVKMFEEFKAYQENINQSMKAGVMNQDEYTKASQILMEKSDKLKTHPVVGGLLKSENDFYAFVNQVLGVVKATITGEVSEEDTGCGGGCGGCKK